MNTVDLDGNLKHFDSVTTALTLFSLHPALFISFLLIYRCYNILYLKIPSSFNSVLLQFLIHAMGSLDFARDDGAFPCCHSEG